MFAYALLAIPMFIIWLVSAKRGAKINRANMRQRDDVRAAGLTEPPSLHPVIDPDLCLGSGACFTACPEGNVLGMIDGKAQLLNPTHCIGHGACLPACPHEAITLVFGTEKRGIDIPHVKENFETDVNGIFIAGELGGMGLIANATEQGRQAMASVVNYRKARPATDDILDVLIVGAGPAGFSASLAALENKLFYRTIEQETMGGRVAHYPRGKIVMTRPTILPLVGKFKIHETTKEALLSRWQEIETETGMNIHTEERMETISKNEAGFRVKTSKGDFETRAVLLCIGRGGTPRKLGVPGESQKKVLYRLSDPAQYRGQKILVVGGGDTALEAAVVLSEQPDTDVILSYRSHAFSRAKEKNRDKVKAAEEKGALTVFLKSTVKEIFETEVSIEQQNEVRHYDNDSVIICAGGILPTAFLKNLGVVVETHHGRVL